MSSQERILRALFPPPLRRLAVNLLGLPPLRIQVGELVTDTLVMQQRLATAERSVDQLRTLVEAIDGFLRDEVALRGLPVPPSSLMEKVAGGPLVSWFHALGKRGAESIEAVLRDHGLRIETFDAILDFGCGCGRVIRHWSHLANTRVHGTDYNPELIAWCRQHLPFASFDVNALTPPLRYADASFDFVYALSVFTHLADATQRAWMDEMRRVLKPGGHLLITTHGDAYLHMLEPDEQRRYHSGELVLRSGTAEGRNECGAFQSETHVRSTLAAGWDVIAFVREGSLGTPPQDLYLMRKP